MSAFEEVIHTLYDDRIRILAQIKARSLGADRLTLMALGVLVYAQLEGGIKGVASVAIRHINARNIEIGRLAPKLLEWRNPDDLARFKTAVYFEIIASPSPFEELLLRQTKVRPIDIRYELNQMSWNTLKMVYGGFSITTDDINKYAVEVDDLVNARNDAAHSGLPNNESSTTLEGQLRGKVTVVEAILTDFGLQMLSLFENNLHLRKSDPLNPRQHRP
jgi:hypothetical protein